MQNVLAVKYVQTVETKTDNVEVLIMQCNVEEHKKEEGSFPVPCLNSCVQTGRINFKQFT